MRYGRPTVRELVLTIEARDPVSATDDLRETLLRLNIEDARRPETTPPSSAKGSALEWAQLVVTFAGSVPVIVTAVRSWVRHHPDSAVILKDGDDELHLSDASSPEQQRLIDEWLRRRDD